MSTDFTRLDALEKQDNIFKAWELRKQHRSFEEIGMILGCSKSCAWGYVKQASELGLNILLDRITADKLVAIDLLDSLISDCFQEIKDATDVCDDSGKLYRDGIKTRSYLRTEILKHLDMKAKILGFYAPERIEQAIDAIASTKDSTEDVDYSQLTTSQLQVLFADKMRDAK